MGMLWSLLGYGVQGRTDDPNPVTGLTSRDVYLIQNSWEIVKKNLVSTGVAIFLLYFDRYPGENLQFPFKNVPIEDLPNNKKFQAHCANVMYSFTAIVDTLNDSELLVNVLIKLGTTHKRFKIPAESFWNIKDVIFDILAKSNDNTTMISWDKALKVATKILAENSDPNS